MKARTGLAPFVATAIAACGRPAPPTVPEREIALPVPPAVAEHEATLPVPRAVDGWMQRHEELCANARKGADLVFVGDSITQGWEAEGRDVWAEFYGGRKALNLGIGGDRTQHVLWRLANGNLVGLEPELVVVMIGTNNTGSDPPERIADGITAVARELWLRLPRAEILVLGIFPRDANASDPLRQAVLATNRLVAEIGERFGDGRVAYLDIGERFLEPDGTLSPAVMPDLLHLSARGYRIWAEAIEPAVEERLGKR